MVVRRRKAKVKTYAAAQGVYQATGTTRAAAIRTVNKANHVAGINLSMPRVKVKKLPAGYVPKRGGLVKKK